MTREETTANQSTAIVAKLKKNLKKSQTQLQKLEEKEWELQELLAKGDAKEIQKLDNYRLELQQELENLKRERNSLLPEGAGLRQYLQENTPAGDREEVLGLLEALTDSLYHLQNVQEVNWDLLRERLRHSREMIELLVPSSKTYDGSGQMYKSQETFNIDKNC